MTGNKTFLTIGIVCLLLAAVCGIGIYKIDNTGDDMVFSILFVILAFIGLFCILTVITKPK